MHVDILIPTYDRLELLKKCIKSIKLNDYKDTSIIVVVDGNKKILDGLKDEPVEILFNPKRMDYVISMNRAIKHSRADAVIYGSDDLIFFKNCISNAVNKMGEHFPDTDGLIALKQVHKEGGTAFGLLGRKFINRFPDSAVFCPDYVHYGSDSELGRIAKHLERIYQCKEAIVGHSRLHDNTYNLALEVRNHDRRIYSRRKNKRLLWGVDLELITQGVSD